MQCCTYGTAIHYCPPQHSQKRYRRILCSCIIIIIIIISSSNTPATSIQPCPTLSVTPHAFDEFVRSNKSVPCVHRAVCTVPRRGCEHMQKAPAVICSLSRQSQRPGCDIAVSGSGWPTVLGRLVEHNLASAAGRRPLVSQRRNAPLPPLLLARSRHRSRPDRPQPASQARKREQSKQSPGTGRCG